MHEYEGKPLLVHDPLFKQGTAEHGSVGAFLYLKYNKLCKRLFYIKSLFKLVLKGIKFLNRKLFEIYGKIYS